MVGGGLAAAVGSVATAEAVGAVGACAVVDAGVGARVVVIGTVEVAVLLADGWAQATSNSTAPNKKMKGLRNPFFMV